MRFIHQQYKVIETREVIKVTFAYVFRQPLDARRTPSAHFRVDLRDVEDVDVNRFVRNVHARQSTLPLPLFAHAAPLFVVVAGNDLRRRLRILGETLKDVLRIAGREVSDELVVDGQVRREHKEVADMMNGVQVCEKSAHQSRFADASGERKAQRWKLALKIRYAWIL